MSFKCSIFGHKYGEPEIERERQEDGSEVVITIRETETCARCGEMRVVSENKEVTTLETAADIVADDLADTAGTTPTPDPEPESAGPSSSEPEPTGQTAQEPATAENDPPIPDAETGGTSVPEPEGAPEDDAVILDESGEDESSEEAESEDEDAAGAPDGARGPGEWPDESDEGDDQPAERAEWPEEPESEETEPSWELPSDISPHPETERSSIESTGHAITVPEGEFYCPNCEFTTAVESSSLREGDFCPECQMAALEHRAE
jgi:ssDNA-binding Zn-finger/Zn-ribbon topoisomerase 1